MLFNSIIFVVFFLICYSLYLLLRKHYRIQNTLLLIASYIFYGYWDWRFTSLLALSTVIDYYIGLHLHATSNPSKRKLFLTISIFSNLSILGFFKYFNFFADSFGNFLQLLGMQVDLITLKIILPVGISFYTFQTLSYTIDIYREKLIPTSDFISFALFVAFFPQLVAGPIERAINLLPQIQAARHIDVERIYTGLFLILWGYFKKLVIADNCGAEIVEPVFSNYMEMGGLDIILAVLGFAFQIYGDFSGYSDIARGLAKIMGFDLMVNFKLPYFSLNPSDFWMRWHVSLSSWLRDYLYIPLGGNRYGYWNTHRNLMLTMILGGLWHGASWNFVIWGFYQGFILIIYRIVEKDDLFLDPWSGSYSRWCVLSHMAVMFVLTCIGWLIFRGESAHQIGYMLTHIDFSTTAKTLHRGWVFCFLTFPLIMVEIWQYRTRNLFAPLTLPWFWRGVFCSFLIIWITIFTGDEPTEFIYFQF